MNRQAALREAAHWAVREDEGGLTAPPPSAAADIQEMLDDPAFDEALTRAAAIGRLSDQEIRSARAERRRTLGTGLAMALLATVGMGYWQQSGFGSVSPIVQHIETRRGELRTVRLADGSTVELDGATSLDVTIDRHARHVKMLRGEAYFDVAHEPGRPFSVQAGASSTRVLGTAFTIDMSVRAVKLAVYRGRVRFAGDGDGRALVVPAGWRSSFAPHSAMTLTRFDPTQQDWRQSWVDTNDMVLGDLIEALNRRGGPLIAAPPPNLANLPLSGRFKLDEADALLGAVGEIYGFRVVRDGAGLHLIPSASGGLDDAAE